MANAKGIGELIAGAGLLALGGLATAGTFGAGTFLGVKAAIWGEFLIQAGAGMALSGTGTIIGGAHDKGFATTMRNPIAPWRYSYGCTHFGGNLVSLCESVEDDR